MGLVYRGVEPDELVGYLRQIERAFGASQPEEQLELWAASIDPARTLAVFDGDAMVATAGLHSMAVTLPGGAEVPMGGLTAIGVRTTHRRRGILTEMMSKMFDDSIGRGEPLMGLLASEGSIYSRFGFGVGTLSAKYDLDSRTARLRDLPPTGGTIEEIPAAEAAPTIDEIHTRYRARQVGEVRPPNGFWANELADLESSRNGESAWYVVIHRSASGTPDGALLYRAAADPTTLMLPDSTARAYRLFGESVEIELALWNHLLSVDLFNQASAFPMPVDPAVRWALTDPRQLQTSILMDWLWLRVQDASAVFSARTYGTDDTFVFEVADTARPELAGRYRITGDNSGGSCEPTTAPADFTCEVSEFSMVVLGGHRMSTLAATGRLIEHQPGAAARADRFFGSEITPFCSIEF